MGCIRNYYKHFPKSPEPTHYIYFKKHTLRLQPSTKGGILYTVGLQYYYFYYHYSYFPSVLLFLIHHTIMIAQSRLIDVPN